MDPVTGAVILGGLGAVGGLFSGQQNQQMSQQQLALEKLLGGRGLDIQSAAVGDALRRQLESMPVRDRVLAQLQARMGQSPAQFNPGGMFSNAAAPTSTGGVDFGALQKAAQNYVPGSGGTRPDIAALMMQKLGYNPQGPGSAPQSGNDWQKALQQTYTNPTSPVQQPSNPFGNLGNILNKPQGGGMGGYIPNGPKLPGFNPMGGTHGPRF